jgi:hypothetical protein
MRKTALKWLWPVLLFAGCVGSPNPAPVFTEEWAHYLESHEDDQNRARNDKRLVLVGDDEAVNAGVELDAEGKPRLNIGGKDSRIGADVDIDSDEQSFGLNYKRSW